MESLGFFEGGLGEAWCKTMKEGTEDTVMWKRRQSPSILWGKWARLKHSRSFGTGTKHGGRRWENQSHVDAFQAVLWADDLTQTFGSWLAQQLTCKKHKNPCYQDQTARTEERHEIFLAQLQQIICWPGFVGVCEPKVQLVIFALHSMALVSGKNSSRYCQINATLATSVHWDMFPSRGGCVTE